MELNSIDMSNNPFGSQPTRFRTSFDISWEHGRTKIDQHRDLMKTGWKFESDIGLPQPSSSAIAHICPRHDPKMTDGIRKAGLEPEEPGLQGWTRLPSPRGSLGPGLHKINEDT